MSESSPISIDFAEIQSNDTNVTDDARLILAYLDGDLSAFDILYQRYKKPLFSYLNKMLAPDYAMADDLFQQVWMKAINHFHQYRHQENFLPWVLRIARNLALDHLKNPRQTKNQYVDKIEEHPAFVGSVAQPWEGMDESLLQNQLSLALENLPKEQREVVILRQQGISFKEISEIQQVSLNTALGRMHYALRFIQTQLNEFTLDYLNH